METLRTQDLDIWIKCDVLFRADSEVDYEELGIPNKETEWSEFYFKLNELENFNEYKDNAEIRLKSGFSAITNIPYEYFKKKLFGDGSNNIN